MGQMTWIFFWALVFTSNVQNRVLQGEYWAEIGDWVLGPTLLHVSASSWTLRTWIMRGSTSSLCGDARLDLIINGRSSLSFLSLPLVIGPSKGILDSALLGFSSPYVAVRRNSAAKMRYPNFDHPVAVAGSGSARCCEYIYGKATDGYVMDAADFSKIIRDHIGDQEIKDDNMSDFLVASSSGDVALTYVDNQGVALDIDTWWCLGSGNVYATLALMDGLRNVPMVDGLYQMPLSDAIDLVRKSICAAAAIDAKTGGYLDVEFLGEYDPYKDDGCEGGYNRLLVSREGTTLRRFVLSSIK